MPIPNRIENEGDIEEMSKGGYESGVFSLGTTGLELEVIKVLQFIMTVNPATFKDKPIKILKKLGRRKMFIIHVWGDIFKSSKFEGTYTGWLK